MDKRIRPTLNYLRSSRLTRVRFGDKKSCAIDQTPSKSFNIDPATGRPMSDIQRLCHLQDDLTLQSQFSQLMEFKSNYLPENTSDEDALKYMCPRYAQLPSELFGYRQQVLEKQIAKQNEIKAAELAAKQKQEEDALFEKLKEEFKTKSE